MRKTKLWLEKGLFDNIVAVVVAVAGEGLYLTFEKEGRGGVGMGMGEGNSILKLLSGSSYGEIIFQPSFLTCERDPMMSKIQTKPPRKNLWIALFKS